VVLALTSSDAADGNHAMLSENLARLKAVKDAKGRALEIVEIEQPARRTLADGRRASLSYINFYLANGGIVMPAFEDPQDKRAYDTLHRVFADREIVQVPAGDIVRGGGGIHCITQQQPAGLPATPLPPPPEA
jgi:agmatine deiminase